MNVLNNSTFLFNFKGLCQSQVRVCILVKMVERTGIEPATSTLPALRSPS